GDVEEESVATVFGRAAHTAILEPDLLEERYVVAGQCGATTSKGERCRATGRTLTPEGRWLCGTHDRNATRVVGKEVISLEDYRRCAAIREAVTKHPRVAAIVNAGGMAEVSMVWQQEGVLCKGRPDF